MVYITGKDFDSSVTSETMSPRTHVQVRYPYTSCFPFGLRSEKGTILIESILGTLWGAMYQVKVDIVYKSQGVELHLYNRRSRGCAPNPREFKEASTLGKGSPPDGTLLANIGDEFHVRMLT